MKGYIGLQGCGTATPASGFYINQLPGINIQAIDNVASADQGNYLKVFSDAQDRAVFKFNNAVISLFKNRFKITSIMRSFDIGKKIDTTSTTTAASDIRGVVYEIDSLEDYIYSSLRLIYVTSVNIYIPAVPADPFDLIFYDVDSESEIYAIPLNDTTAVTVGWNTVIVEKGFAVRSLFIGYESDQIDSVELNISSTMQSLWCGCVQHICGGDSCGTIQGAILDSGTITTGNDAFGFSPLISLQCSFAPIVCANKNIFLPSWWNLLGAEIMQEVIGSDRTNFTTLNKEEAKEKFDMFDQEFMSELKTAVDAIDIDTADACIECNSQIRYAGSKI